MAYGITATGFLKKTLAIIKGEYESAYKQAFGNSINLQPPSNIATTIGIAADREASIWNLAEECWNARGASTAKGVSLDNVGELIANPRIASKPSKTFNQIFFGTAGAIIPTTLIVSVVGNSTAKFSPFSAVTLIAGTNEVQTLTFSLSPDAGTWTITMPDGQITASLAYNALASVIQTAIQALPGFDGVTVMGDYSAGFTVTFVDGAIAGSAGAQNWALMVGNSTLTHTSTPVVITATESTAGVPQGTGIMVALTNGPTVANAKTLTVIETPVTGLTATKNLDDATIGRLTEMDSQYRIRRLSELQKNSSATVEAIRIAIKNVLNVNEAIVYENTTLTTDGNGVPAKSVHVYVDGGANQDIWDALWLSVGAGIATYGSVSGTVVDSQGLSQTLKFDRPTEKPVYVTIAIVKGPDYPLTGDDLVLDAVLTYAAGLTIGDDVLVYPKLLPAVVDNIPGITDITVKVGFSATPTLSTNLAIAPNERAQFTSSNILVSST